MVKVKQGKDGKELKKQGVMVADKSGACRLVLWESDVETVEPVTSSMDVSANMGQPSSCASTCVPELQSACIVH